MEMLKEGKSAPDLTLPSTDATQPRLVALRGRPFVLHFYPRDNTPGCTREAGAFRAKEVFPRVGVDGHAAAVREALEAR